MGRPPKTSAKQSQKSRTAKTLINANAKMKDLKFDPAGTQYRCSACGTYYDKQKGNFRVSHSVLFSGNNGYVTTCNSCTEKHYKFLVDSFSGNEEKALDRICSIFDWYYNDDIAGSAKKSSNDSRLAAYIKQLNLPQNSGKGTTYFDTIKERATTTIDSFEDLEETKETGEIGVSATAIKRWGFGYEPEEYSMLAEHYKVLTTQYTNADAVQDALIKDLCIIKVLQNRSVKTGDADNFNKFTKLYHSTLKTGNLKSRTEENADDENSCWGNYIKEIETHCPADIYQNKAIFDDVDGVKEYFNRFILRPMINFFSGSRIQDEEFSVQAGEDDIGQE